MIICQTRSWGLNGKPNEQFQLVAGRSRHDLNDGVLNCKMVELRFRDVVCATQSNSVHVWCALLTEVTCDTAVHASSQMFRMIVKSLATRSSS